MGLQSTQFGCGLEIRERKSLNLIYINLFPNYLDKEQHKGFAHRALNQGIVGKFTPNARENQPAKYLKCLTQYGSYVTASANISRHRIQML